ncbi:ComF family protein [Vallitalea guaymasensis]|uniref:ComF family protein n=1 Tax=Vallitalea guaymasensis TaxID=1185412 RepID=UPI0023554016|nr:phosphoribosyltransferase [Vallitalea guaymasensis]
MFKDDNNILYIENYQPYRIYDEIQQKRVVNPKFDSGMMLDLKDKKKNAMEHYYKILLEELEDELNGQNICITVVPSHKPGCNLSGVQLVAKKLISKCKCINALKCLERVVEIDKLALGGDRDIDIHLESIEVRNQEIFNNKKVIILDDITTTGNSLLACKLLLKEKGAKKIACVAIAKTENEGD